MVLHSNPTFKVVIVFFGVLVPLFTSVRTSIFLVDQYVYYRYSIMVGLPYGQDDGKGICENKTNDAVNNTEEDKRNWVQTRTAYLTSVNNFVEVATGMLATIAMGYVSDRYGRRFVLLWIMLSEALRVCLAALIIMFNANPWTVLIPNMLEGLLCGGLLSAIAQISVCIVDVTKRENATDDRASKNQCLLFMTFMDALACLSMAAGNAICGSLIYHSGFIMAALVSLILFVPGVIAIYWLPETNQYLTAKRSQLVLSEHPESHNSSSDELHAIGEVQSHTLIGHIRTNIQTVHFELIKLFGHGRVLSLTVIAIAFLFSIAAVVDLHYLFLYLMGPPFCWNSASLGLYSSLSDVVSAIFAVSVVILITVTKRRYWSRQRTSPEQMGDVQPCLPDDTRPRKGLTQDQKRLVLFLASGMVPILLHKITIGIAYLFQPLVAFRILYFALALKVTKSMNIPAMRALLASDVPKNEQGRLFALTALAERLGLLISVTALPSIYVATLTTFPAAVFFCTAGLLGLALILIGLLPVLPVK